jgi:hypothetical protein
VNETQKQNAYIRAKGVIWVDCECGRPWPFPVGSGTHRDFQCEACARAEWAKEIRVLRSELASAKAGAMIVSGPVGVTI